MIRRSYVILRIYSESISHEAISLSLKVNPSFSVVRDQAKGYLRNGFFLSTKDIRNGKSPFVNLNDLMAHSMQGIRHLQREGCLVDIVYFLELGGHSAGGGPILLANEICQWISIGVDIHFDIYCIDDPTAD